MTLQAFATVVAALSLTTACGSSGDDGTTDTTDDTTAIDATPEVDAVPANIATELGQVCQDPSECPPDASECLAFMQGADSGMCTLTCGTSTDGMPPASGNPLCADQYDGSSGTPLCAGGSAPVGGTTTWRCLIACGTFDNNGTPVELGSCPNDLTCSMNVCS